MNEKNVVRIAYCLILICIALWNLVQLYPFSSGLIITRIDGLLGGGILAILIRENVRLLEKIIPFVFTLSFLAILTIYLTTQSFADSNPLFIKIGYALFDVFFGCIVIMVFSTGKAGSLLRGMLEGKSLIFFGKYSYGIYVYHWLLFCFLNPRFLSFYQKLNIAFADPQILAALTCTLVAIFISYQSYNLFEKQFLKQKKYLSYANEEVKPVLAIT